MNFKEHAAQDIPATFFNVDEFSDEVTIDGKLKGVVIDEDQLKERAAEYGGITTGTILYFISVSSFSERPKIGSSQIFNNKLMYVEDVREDMGVYEIILNQNRGE